jgi:hypothetical protein
MTMRFLTEAVQILTCANLLVTMATTGIRLRRRKREKDGEPEQRR